MNRAPTYLFWNAAWYSKFALKNVMYLDFFLKKLLYLFFFGGLNRLFLDQAPKNKNVEYLSIDLATKNDDNPLPKERSVYLSKAWILRFRGWVIVVFFIFYPSGTTASDTKTSAENRLSWPKKVKNQKNIPLRRCLNQQTALFFFSSFQTKKRYFKRKKERLFFI